jgi:molybdopterin molybdotransferase
VSLPNVEAARATMLGAVVPLTPELVPVGEADGRWLLEPVRAVRDQPPFHASAMDGWAVRAANLAPGARLRIVGESAAGHAPGGAVGPGEAMRIFTGAALPDGADHVVVQEEAERDGDHVVLGKVAGPAYVRPRGGDFRAETVLLEAGVRINPWRLALAAAAGGHSVVCGRRPRVAVLANGDELVEPGEAANPHQIYNSAAPALAAFARRHGGEARTLRSPADDEAAIRSAVQGADFDLLVTIGGASVGDHDRVKPALRALGAELKVEGVAVRPGKPVWFAVLTDGRPMLGLPGNPASALVCAELFLAPILAALQGGTAEVAIGHAVLSEPLSANGPRDHYMRAVLDVGPDAVGRATPFANQDSSLVTVMARSNVLLRRPPGAAASVEGETVEVVRPTR